MTPRIVTLCRYDSTIVGTDAMTPRFSPLHQQEGRAGLFPPAPSGLHFPEHPGASSSRETRPRRKRRGASRKRCRCGAERSPSRPEPSMAEPDPKSVQDLTAVVRPGPGRHPGGGRVTPRGCWGLPGPAPGPPVVGPAP